MKSNKIVTLIAMLVLCVNGALADGAKFRISEVAIDSTKGSWIELQNTSWGTQDFGGFYITNDPAALNPELSAPERIKKMRLVPTGNPFTEVKPQNCIVFKADNKENEGIEHLAFTLHPGDVVAVYSGNGVSLIDSVTIPANLHEGQSYACDFENEKWNFCQTPTPTRDNNYVKKQSMNKISEFKEKDPHGIAMTILAMGIVFGCLILLYIFFVLFGKVVSAASKKTEQADTAPAKAAKPSKASKSSNKEEEIAAAIAVTQASSCTADDSLAAALIALTLSAEFAHDEESGVITINQTNSDWADKGSVIGAGMLK
jgi:sodium pump decarboxylase gamma subunit